MRPQQVSQELLSRVTKVLRITALDQWYHVSHHAASKAIGVRALNNFGSLSGFLKLAYPHHRFDEEKLSSRTTKEKDQKFLEVIIRQLFPNTEIHTKARKAVGILNPQTNAYLEIDFWMPSLKLGIEYQDKHHYGHQWYANESLEAYQKRDSIKKDTMPALGYTLITVGCWWDKNIESLAATIRKFRPELLPQYENSRAEPIPSEPPPGFITQAPVIPGVVGLMSPFVPGYDFNPIDWYAGEKHDGIRGVYNPQVRKIFSRSGKELSLHNALLRDIPNMIVEGEIVSGRGNYNKTAAVSYYSHYAKVNWPMFRYVLFDIPDAELGNYTQRYAAIASGLSTRAFIFAQSAFRVLVASKLLLKMLVDSIIGDAGEGAIVQRDAPYEYGRATGLAKIKVHRDADAQVLSVNELTCTCKLPTGITADVPFHVYFDPSTLKIGDIISYYHNGYTQSGTPKQGEIYKIRYDLSWEQLLSDKDQSTSKKRSVKDAIGSSSLITYNIVKRNKMGHWNKPPNVREYFDEYARKASFDPLVPDNWYSVRTKAVQQSGGAGLLYAHGFNLKRALSCAYPELKFEKEKFRTHALKGHWSTAANVREYFDEFAKSAGFDPLALENWYSVGPRAVQNVGGGGLLFAFGFNLPKALSFAYPELKFDKEKFRTHAQKGHWNDSQNVRAFFDNFAAKTKFDPLVPANWYPVKHSSLLLAKGSGLLSAYNLSLHKALSVAYPELKFEEEKFQSHAKRE